MNDTLSPEVFGEVLAQLDTVAAIVKKLNGADLSAMQVSDKATVAKIIDILARDCENAKPLIEAYFAENNANPDYKWPSQSAVLNPLSAIKGFAQVLLSRFNWESPEVVQDLKDLNRHSETLWKMVFDLE